MKFQNIWFMWIKKNYKFNETKFPKPLFLPYVNVFQDS